MKRTREMRIGVTTVVCAIAIGAGGTAFARADDTGDEYATGVEADRARAAALALLPDGRANSVERDNEDGATWEVEVTRADGRSVDVRLDSGYRVVVIEGDSEDATGEGAAG